MPPRSSTPCFLFSLRTLFVAVTVAAVTASVTPKILAWLFPVKHVDFDENSMYLIQTNVKPTPWIETESTPDQQPTYH